MPPVILTSSHRRYSNVKVIVHSKANASGREGNISTPHQAHLRNDFSEVMRLKCLSARPAHTFKPSRERIANPSGRAVYSVGLRPLACWDCGFESHRGHGCLSVVGVVCCQEEVSATSWSLVQRSPTDCGASLYTFNPLRASITWIIYIDTWTHSISVTKTNHWTLCTEIKVVCSKNHIRHTNALWRKHVLFKLKPGDYTK
jgi:hypothetical protein